MAAPARIVAGDVLGDTYEIVTDNVKLSARREPNRVELAVVGKPERKGVIRFGSPSSGALWVDNECIGEYELIKDEYVITPVVNGRRFPDSTTKLHPVQYLLQKLTAKP